MKNNLLTEKLVYTGESETSTRIKLASYNASKLEETEGNTITDVVKQLSINRINWLQVSGLTNTEAIQEICEHFEIDFLVLQDILNIKHPAKIEEYDKYIFVVLKLFKFNQGDNIELEQQQVCIVQGSNFVLTFLETDSPIFEDISHAIHNNVLKMRSRQSDYLLSVLLNSIMSNYIYIVSAIDDSLEGLEEELLKTTNASDIGVQIQTLRRQYLQIKKGVLPLKEQYIKILHSDSPLIHKANRAYFNDVNDHLQFVLQTIEICREILSSLVDLYISNNDLRMNDIMKRLTVVSTIFIPITFLAGLWGMNFEFMPELNWKHGYLAAWLIMIGIGGAIYLYFKKKKWY